ncbi:MAG: hypothetical protein ACE5EO_01590 [Candidatus Krumholzibacteriia bacterium]
MTRRTLRLVSIIVVVAAAFTVPALGAPVPDRDVRVEKNRITVPEPWSVEVLEQELGETAQKATSALSACARTVVTVAKAVVRALQALVLTLVTVLFHLAVSLVLSLGKFLLGILVG